MAFFGGDEFLRTTRPILEAGDLDALILHLRCHWPNELLRELLSCGSEDACKVALFGLSLLGTSEDCSAVSTMLHNDDSYTVKLAEHALWSIWLRGKTPVEQARMREAVLLIAQDRLQEATRGLCELIDDSPDFAEAYNQRAIAEFLEGRYPQARDDLRQALRLNPLHFAAIAGLGHCAAAEGFCEAAMDYYQQALSIHPRAEGLKQAIEELRNLLIKADASSPLASNKINHQRPGNGRLGQMGDYL